MLLNKEEIIEAVQKTGYSITTNKITMLPDEKDVTRMKNSDVFNKPNSKFVEVLAKRNRKKKKGNNSIHKLTCFAEFDEDDKLAGITYCVGTTINDITSIFRDVENKK